MTAILAWLGSFLTGPLLKGALDAYKAKLANQNNEDARTADLASKTLEADLREEQLRSQLKVAEVGHWYEPEKLFAYVVLVYFAKLLVWDKVLGNWTHGSTDPLTGWSGITATAVVGFYFSKRGIENVARILKRQ